MWLAKMLAQGTLGRGTPLLGPSHQSRPLPTGASDSKQDSPIHSWGTSPGSSPGPERRGPRKGGGCLQHLFGPEQPTLAW